MSLLHLHREVETEPPELHAPVVPLDPIEPSAAPHITVLLEQVDRLLTVPGVTFSPRFTAVRNGIHALAVLETTLATDALDTVLAATRADDPLPAAYPAVLAALSDVRHSAAATVQHVLLGSLHAEAALTADRNYAAVAAAFDQLVATLADAMEVADIRATAVDRPEWSAEERDAWLTAEQTARALDEHAALLVLAARLAGKELGHESHRPDAETDEWLQLTVDTRGWHRRLVWDTWDAPIDNAAGVWGWMLLAGFDLRATPLAGVQPYRRPSAAERDQQDAAVARRPISWRRATGLLASGCLALGIALGCSAFAAGFFVAAVIEPRDILVAARDALVGLLLLGAGVASGLTWSTFAAVGYDFGTIELVPERRETAPVRTAVPWTSRFVEVPSRLTVRGQYSFSTTK